MSFSVEQREALRRRAEELRTEVSALTAERDAALTQQAQDLADAKLLAEVAGLETQREIAEQQRDQAVNDTGKAMEIMQAAIEKQQLVAAQQNAGSSEPAIAETNENKIDVTPADPNKVEKEEVVKNEDAPSDAEVAQAADERENVEDVPPSELSAATNAEAAALKKTRGGSR